MIIFRHSFWSLRQNEKLDHLLIRIIYIFYTLDQIDFKAALSIKVVCSGIRFYKKFKIFPNLHLHYVSKNIAYHRIHKIRKS